VAWQTILTGLLTLGAIARITRLFNEDTITAPLRTWLDKKAEDHWYAADESKPDQLTHATRAPRHWRYAAKLIHCPWCLGFWVSALVLLGYFTLWLDTWPTASPTAAFTYLAATFAASQATGLAAEWLDSPPPMKQVQLMPTHVTVRQDPPTT
jgi:hypothetical protein